MKPCKEIVLTRDLRDSCSKASNVSYLCSFKTCIFSSSSLDFKVRNSFFRTQGTYENIRNFKAFEYTRKEKGNSEIGTKAYYLCRRMIL